MHMKEKVIRILGEFLERNKEYVIHAYIRNGVTGKIFSNMTLLDWQSKEREKEYLLMRNKDEIIFNQNLVVSYEEVMTCYEERDEFGQQSIYVVLKNGMIFEMECCGERMEK